MMRSLSYMASCLFLAALKGNVSALSLPPPPPPLRSIPLPAKLAGGLFLFQTSVKRTDRPFCDEILAAAQAQLRADPIIMMELGAGLEAGGVFSSSVCQTDSIRQVVMEFQINGGNSWAQAKVHGIQVDQAPVYLVSLEVSNMDAALMTNVPPFRVKLPPWNKLDE
jgi:hypothetical protein